MDEQVLMLLLHKREGTEGNKYLDGTKVKLYLYWNLFFVHVLFSFVLSKDCFLFLVNE